MKKLNEPVTIKGIQFNTRLFLPPMATGKSDDGKVSQELLDYYDRITKGGYFGLVIVEHEYVSRDGMASVNQLSVSDDSDIEGLRALADVIHANGSKAVLQINHAGAKACTGPVSREMTQEELDAVVQSFASAALRCRTAGYDGVEIHAAHGYLLSQFYSPLTNKRTDAYTGNTLQGRTKLHCAILRSVRSAVGDDYPVLIRFGVTDDKEGGAVSEDAPAAAQLFKEAGADLIDVSGGLSGYIRPHIKTPGYYIEEAAAIRRAVNIPVITAGGVTAGKEAQKLLDAYPVDMIGVARAMLKDVEWARKAFEEL